SLMIFLIAWLLADEEKIGGHRTLPEDRLRRAPPERAGAARGRRAAQRSVTSLGGRHGTHDVSLMSVVTSMGRANEGMRSHPLGRLNPIRRRSRRRVPVLGWKLLGAGRAATACADNP